MMSKLMVALAALSLAPAAAQALEAQECAIQADLVMQAVEVRAQGADSEMARQRVLGGLTGPSEKYAGIVPAVVDWVYTLPQAQLGPAVGESWTQACIAQ